MKFLAASIILLPGGVEEEPVLPGAKGGIDYATRKSD